MANEKKKKKSVSKSSSKKSNKSKKVTTNKKVTKKTTPKKGVTKSVTKSVTGESPKKVSKVSNIENGLKNNKVDDSEKIVVNEVPKEKVVKRKISIRKIVTLFVLICIVFVCGIVFNKPKKQGVDYKFNEINYNTYLELFNGEDISYIYLIKDDCSECNISKSNVYKLESEMKIKINELNIDNLTDDEFKNIYNGISAPVLISVKDGKIIKEESATRDYNILKSFVINSQKPVDTYSFNKINVSEYIKLLNSKELTYIYMCSDTSCKEQNRVLDDISKTKKVKVNYLNLDEVTTVGDWELLNNSDKIFEDTWFVPVNIIVKNGKIKSYKMEVLDEDGLKEFLEDNGMW